MIHMPLQDIISVIIDKSGLSREEVIDKINSKKKQLADLVSDEGAAHIIANELGIKLFEHAGKLKIKNVLAGMRAIELVAKVQRIFDVREFDKGNAKGKVATIVVGDETGTIRVVLWHSQTDYVDKIKIGDIIKITDGLVKENQDRKEIHSNEKSRIIINPEGELISDIVKPERKNIADLREGDSATVLAAIVQVFDLKFFDVCPECRKKIVNGSCSAHGTITPATSYILNLFVDDGTENIRAVLFSKQAEQFLKKTNEELSAYKDLPQGFEELKNSLLGMIVKIEGKVKNNSFFNRNELVVDSIKEADPGEELKNDV